VSLFEEIDFGEFISGIAPDVISAVGTGIGASQSTSDNTDINAAYSQGIRQSTDLLTQGYDDQQAQIEQGSDYLRGLLEAGLIDTNQFLEMAAAEYEQDLSRSVGEYSGYMLPQYDEFGNLVMQADQGYRQDLDTTEAGAGDYLREGAEGYEQAYAPYTQGGDAAMEYLMQVMASNPEALTASQRDMLEGYQRDAIARVAASGLRGSGRAGIAAVNSGDADMRAQLYDINQRRADDAAQAMAQYGYGATGNVANSRQSMANNLADLRFKTGNLQSANTLNTANRVADTGFNLTKDFADKRLTADQEAARAQYGTTRDVSGNVGNFYGNMAKLEGGRFQARADTEFGKALAESGAATRQATADAQTAQANSSIKSNATGQIANTLSTAAKRELQKENDKSTSIAQPTTQTYQSQGSMPWQQPGAQYQQY
jgi:hypothetical protein